MTFHIFPIARDFLVVNASTTTVERLRLVLSARSTAWVVLRDEQRSYVFSAKEILTAVTSRRPSESLTAALSLNSLSPSIPVAGMTRVQLEGAPQSGTPASRVVVVRKSKAFSVISAIGSLEDTSAAKRMPSAVKKSKAVSGRFPRRGATSGRLLKKSAPAKKKAAAKKAAPKKRKTHIAAPLSFGFGGQSTQTAAPQPKRKVRSYSVVDVFYATDRELSAPSAGDAMVRYLNRLPAKRALQYGVCRVTVPDRHLPGKIESPSIWNFEFSAVPEKHFTISNCTRKSQSTFLKELSGRVGKTDERSCFVFIHGYNVSFTDAAMRTAQLAYDLKFLGTPLLYSWASAASWTKYPKDVETVDMTVDSLARFLEQVVASTGAKTIHLIAHSMGNRALVKSLKQMAPTGSPRLFKQVVLTAPDVPRQNVEPLIAAASAKAERVTLYASSKDKALGLSKVKNDYERLGKVYGFPYVLPGMDSIDASKVKTDFWEHAGFAKARTVLSDLAALILDGHPPEKRFGLKRVNTPDGVSWTILP